MERLHSSAFCGRFEVDGLSCCSQDGLHRCQFQHGCHRCHFQDGHHCCHFEDGLHRGASSDYFGELGWHNFSSLLSSPASRTSYGGNKVPVVRSCLSACSCARGTPRYVFEPNFSFSYGNVFQSVVTTSKASASSRTTTKELQNCDRRKTRNYMSNF